MLLRHRAPQIESRPSNTSKGYEHIEDKSIAVLRWLQESRVEFVLVGAVAEAVRGNLEAHGPVAIVPAPYDRNHERLARALGSAHARIRVERARPDGSDTAPVKLDAEKLASSKRWTLRCGVHDLDVEGRSAGAPRYQELLYEAGRFALAPDVEIEVASPEDLEHYRHLRQTGSAPEIKITRNAQVPQS
jgi:hypothetical protein